MVEVGKKYAMLTCIGKDNTKDNRYWLFKCDCGNITSKIGNNVERGATSSCGCYQKAFLKAGLAHKTYGYSHTRIDHIYKGMLARCYNSNEKGYRNYGGRGITICNEWLNDKTKFFEWAFKNGYNEDLTIDRIDVNGNYEPSNCRWATYKQQANNTRMTKFITCNGIKHSIHEWEEITGIKSGTIWSRLVRGDSPERALRPVKRKMEVAYG